MSLSKLAALAAEKVPEFKRPESGLCSGCGYEMGYCACSEKGPEWDNSPAALLMAVWIYIGKNGLSVEADGLTYTLLDFLGVRETAADATPESIARAFVVALLRAHGVDRSLDRRRGGGDR